MNEGGRCYDEPVEREECGRSKKIVKKTDNCDVKEQYMAVTKFYNFLGDCMPNDKNEPNAT